MSSARFSVPREFVELLQGIEKEMLPKRVIDCLMWASTNPQLALQVAKTHEKLRSFGKREFVRHISWGMGFDEAINLAAKADAERRRKRSLLSKAVSKAKNGGYAFKMPNGLKGTLIYSSDYWFVFNVEGEEVRLCSSGGGLGHILDSLLSGGPVSPYMFTAVVYCEKCYSSSSKIGQAVVDAVIKNVKPSIAILIG